MKHEIWKDIPGYEGSYQASTDGNIRSVDRIVVRSDGVRKPLTGVVLSPSKNASGYYNVSLRKDGKARSFLVSRLVAITFLPNPSGLPEVNHKNEIKTDNRIENLEWISRLDNCNYGTRNDRHSDFMSGKYTGKEHSHPHPVKCITTGERFECIRSAADAYGLKSPSSISACCRRKTKTAGCTEDGRRLRWKYDDS